MKKLFAALAVLAVTTGAVALAQPAADGMAGRLRAMDRDNDGAITKAEARAAREVAFRALDTDNDGFITAAEKQAARDAAAKKRRERDGGGGDTDNDGKVSRAEFVDAPYRIFERLDANNNDILDASELAAARAMMQQRKKTTP